MTETCLLAEAGSSPQSWISAAIGLAGRGGLCYSQNIFAFIRIRSIIRLRSAGNGPARRRGQDVRPIVAGVAAFVHFRHPS